MKILKETEHPDGSATFLCDLTEEEQHFLINLGFNTMLKEACEKALEGIPEETLDE